MPQIVLSALFWGVLFENLSAFICNKFKLINPLNNICVIIIKCSNNIKQNCQEAFPIFCCKKAHRTHSQEMGCNENGTAKTALAYYG